MDILLELAKAFLQIGVFSFGGGYAIVALIRYVVVQQYAWLTDLEFLDVLAVSQINTRPHCHKHSYVRGLPHGRHLGQHCGNILLHCSTFPLGLFHVQLAQQG